MDGAIESGLRAANEILNPENVALKNKKEQF